MLRAVIFDFNGVLVDDEPLHLEMFRKVLQEEGLSFSDEEYYARYLGLDDRGCFRAVYRHYGKEIDNASLARLIGRKARYYRVAIDKEARLFPAAKSLALSLSAHFPLAIASGALRSEIDLILDRSGLRGCFEAIVSSEDVTEGKPEPEIFLKALALLNRPRPATPLASVECLVIEDSREGIAAAHRAGMRCLAVAHSYPPDALSQADAVVASLENVTTAFLQSLFD